MIKKYRKKPLVVQAIQFLNGDGPNTIRDCIAFTQNKAKVEEIEDDCFLIIPTLEGEHMAVDGDYIIRGIKGEFYPCKPSIFESSYEEVVQQSEGEKVP